MKRLNKLLLALVCIVLIIGCTICFFACDKEDPYTLNGVKLSSYRIVYDDKDVFSKHSATILQQYIADLTGITLEIKADEQVAYSTYEILIGSTDRTESHNMPTSALNKYAFGHKNNKIVVYSGGYLDKYMVGGGVYHLVNKVLIPQLANGRAINYTDAITVYDYQWEDANNVILMIGDGMGFNTINMAESNNIFDKFSAEYLPNQGESITRSYSVMMGEAGYTDSAAGATALATGYKTYNKTIGKDHEGNRVKNVRELAYENGAKTAVITTDVITGATPAGFIAHVDNRGQEAFIKDAIKSAQRNGSLTVAEGLIENSLLDRIIYALNTISQDDSDFFIMIEEAQIDKTADDNNFDGLMDAMDRFNDVIAYTMVFTLMHPDTVLIITADHETGGIISDTNNEYIFTTTSHTNVNVPIFAVGNGTEVFNNAIVENIDIAKFIASIYGEDNFGGAYDFTQYDNN